MSNPFDHVADSLCERSVSSSRCGCADRANGVCLGCSRRQHDQCSYVGCSCRCRDEVGI